MSTEFRPEIESSQPLQEARQTETKQSQGELRTVDGTARRVSYGKTDESRGVKPSEGEPGFFSGLRDRIVRICHVLSGLADSVGRVFERFVVHLTVDVTKPKVRNVSFEEGLRSQARRDGSDEVTILKKELRELTQDPGALSTKHATPFQKDLHRQGMQIGGITYTHGVDSALWESFKLTPPTKIEIEAISLKEDELKELQEIGDGEPKVLLQIGNDTLYEVGINKRLFSVLGKNPRAKVTIGEDTREYGVDMAVLGLLTNALPDMKRPSNEKLELFRYQIEEHFLNQEFWSRDMSFMRKFYGDYEKMQLLLQPSLGGGGSSFTLSEKDGILTVTSKLYYEVLDRDLNKIGYDAARFTATVDLRKISTDDMLLSRDAVKLFSESHGFRKSKDEISF